MASATATTGSVTMVSENGDWVGGGVNQLFDAPGSLSIDGGTGYINVGATPAAPSSTPYSFEFAPPSGTQLHVGEYDNAQRYPFEPAGSPGLTVSGNGRGCNTDYGTLVIKDLHLNSSGYADRFWALYEQHCEGPAGPALFGEVRVGEPAPVAGETVEPAAIDWPYTSVVGQLGTWVPVTVIAGLGGSHIASVAVGGANASDFVVGGDQCSGAVLAPGARCQIQVALKPSAAGDRSAQLVITDATSNATTVPLALLALPEVTGVSPGAGPPAGGTAVTISGRQFTGVTGVMFGPQPAASYKVDSPTQITAMSPPGSGGSTVDVTVSNSHGMSWRNLGDQFTYANPPGAPTGLSATGGVRQVTVSFTAPSSNGGSTITHYTVTASPGGAQATGTTTPITVAGLSDGTTYTFTATATNAVGTGPASAPSNAATTLKPTTTTIEAAPATSYFGTPVQFNADVTSTFTGVPTGSVQFSAYGSNIGSPVPLDGSGKTTNGPIGSPDVGSTINASYGGDSAFAPSDGSLQPDIRPAQTSTALSSSANPSTPGSSVTIVATVSNTSTSVVPFGSVQFAVNGNPVLSPIALNDSGQAGIIARFPAGNYVITGSYHDDTAAIPDFVDSQGSLTQVITYTPPPPPPPPPPVPPPPPQTHPTNDSAGQQASQGAKGVFLVGTPSTAAGGLVMIPAQSPDAGQFNFVATIARRAGAARGAARRRASVYGRGTLTINRAGPVTLLIKPTARAKRLLATRKRLQLQITISFKSASGGQPMTSVVTATVTRRRARAGTQRLRSRADAKVTEPM